MGTGGPMVVSMSGWNWVEVARFGEWLVLEETTDRVTRRHIVRSVDGQKSQCFTNAKRKAIALAKSRDAFTGWEE